jgi:hypothetical protein
LFDFIHYNTNSLILSSLLYHSAAATCLGLYVPALGSCIVSANLHASREQLLVKLCSLYSFGLLLGGLVRIDVSGYDAEYVIFSTLLQDPLVHVLR